MKLRSAGDSSQRRSDGATDESLSVSEPPVALKLLLDSFWRAAAYCLHPRVIMLSLLPLVLMAALALGLGYFLWDPAVDAVRSMFGSWAILITLAVWMQSIGVANLQ